MLRQDHELDTRTDMTTTRDDLQQSMTVISTSPDRLLKPAAAEPTVDIPAPGEQTGRLSIVIGPNWLIWAGTLAVVAGFGLLAYTWDRVSTLTIVAAQIPYLVSSGFTGLGLIVVGAALVIVWSRRADDTERRRQTDELVDALHEIRAGLQADREQ
jgi:hypothetical protein